MSSHIWGDEWFENNGNDLNEAIYYCMNVWRTWGRIGTHGKEKYGTFRDHVYFYNAYWAVHELIKPGHVAFRWPRLLMFVDIFLGKVVRFVRLDRLIRLYQYQVYNYAIQKMCKKYPNIVDELVSDLEAANVVKPGIFGKIDGASIRKKYWTNF